MTLWIDCSSTLDWRRPAVGVIRTEAECLRYAIDNIPNEARFCRYLPVEGVMTEISPNIITDHLEFLDGEKLQSQATGYSKTRMLKSLLKSLIQRLPKKLGNKIYFFVSKNRNSIFKVLHQLKRISEKIHAIRAFTKSILFRKIVNKTNIYPEIFKTGDTYLSMGAEWNYKQKMNLIFEKKKDFDLRVVLFCYDIIPITLPHLTLLQTASVFSLYFTNVAWCADRILCISNYSKNELDSFLDEIGTPKPLLSVIKLGSDIKDSVFKEPTNEITGILGTDYILYVSSIERRKNHETLYKAYVNLIEKGIKKLPILIFVGMPGWGTQDFLQELSLDYRVKPFIKILNKVSDSDLKHLYRHCLFTVFPSLSEGWGLPVSESLSYGKLCISSNKGSLPEAGQNLVEYLDPWDVKGWSETIQFYYTNPNILKEKEKTIIEQYRVFTWEESAKLIIQTAKEEIRILN